MKALFNKLDQIRPKSTKKENIKNQFSQYVYMISLLVKVDLINHS